MKAGLRRRGVEGDCSPETVVLGQLSVTANNVCADDVARLHAPVELLTSLGPTHGSSITVCGPKRCGAGVASALHRLSRQRAGSACGSIPQSRRPGGRDGATYTPKAWASDQESRQGPGEAHVSGTLPAMAEAHLCAPRLPFVASHPSPKRLPDADLGCRTAGVDRSSQVVKPDASFTQRPANRDARKGPAARVAGLACLS